MNENSKQNKIQEFCINLNLLVFTINLPLSILSRYIEVNDLILKISALLTVFIFIFCVISFCWYIKTCKKENRKNGGIMWGYLIINSGGIIALLYYIFRHFGQN